MLLIWKVKISNSVQKSYCIKKNELFFGHLERFLFYDIELCLLFSNISSRFCTIVRVLRCSLIRTTYRNATLYQFVKK